MKLKNPVVLKGILYGLLVLIILQIVAFQILVSHRAKERTLGANAVDLRTLDERAFLAKGEADQLIDLKELISTNGSADIWQFLVRVYKTEPQSASRAHDLAHYVGGLIFDEYTFEGLNICTPDFAFGCYHGFFDSAFRNSLDKLTTAEAGCLKVGKRGTGPNASCVHGIGHGIATFYKLEDLPAALAACDKLNNGSEYCADGVFMEYERSAPDTYYKTDDPFFPCDTVEAKYMHSCARNQTTVMMQRLSYDFQEVVSACLHSEDEPFKQGCFESLGFAAINSDSVIDSCNVIGQEPYRSQCLMSAAREVIFQDIPGWEQSSLRYCDAVSPEKKTECVVGRQQIIKDYGRDKKRDAVPLGVRSLQKKENKDAYVRSQMQLCLDNHGQDTCYEQVAAVFSQQFSLKESLALLARNEKYPAVYARCHEVTHFLSRNEMKKVKSIPAVYASCDSTCHGGCYHGAMEQYFSEAQLESTEASLKQQIATICGDETSFRTPLIYYECEHGLGHAAMFITVNDLPQALALCDILDSIKQKERCYSGVFMENSSSSTSTDHPTKYVSKTDSMYPCSILEERYLHMCYTYQSSYFAEITHYDWKQVASLCGKVPEKYRSDCFMTIGSNQVGFTQDTSVMITNCLSMPMLPFQEACIQGVMGSFSSRFPGKPDRMIAFCSKVPEKYKPFCYQAIENTLSYTSTDSIAIAVPCASISDRKYASWCQ